MTLDDVLRAVSTLLVFGAILALVLEVHLIWKLWRAAPTVVALRERLIASSVRTTAACLTSVVVLDGLLGINIITGTINYVIVAAALAVLAIPAIRFQYLYHRRGFRPPPS